MTETIKEFNERMRANGKRIANLKINWHPKKIDLEAERERNRPTPWEQWERAYFRWEEAYNWLKSEEEYLEWIERNLNV